MKSLISVIIPVRKGGSPKVTIDSLNRQTFRNFETIIVNDDNNRGAPYCRNRGFEASKSPFVLFSDDDIAWKPNAFQRLYDTLNAHPEASFAFGSYHLINYDGTEHKIGRPFRWDPGELMRRNYISTMSLIRRGHFPGFDEGLTRLQDWELWIRMLKLGYSGAFTEGGDLFSTEVQAGNISDPKDKEAWKKADFRVRRTHRSPLFDIVIPNYVVDEEVAKIVLKCLESIRKTVASYRLILVDNGSPKFRLIARELSNHHVKVIRNNENLGFVKASNQGIRESESPFVVLLNNDAELTPGSLAELLKPHFMKSEVGLSGPRTDARASWQGRERDGDGFQILRPDQMIAFFCTVIKRHVFDDIGVLDESFGIGFGDDDNFCRRANKAGWKVAFVRSAFVRHNHRTTFRKLFTEQEINAMQQTAIRKVKAKW